MPMRFDSYTFRFTFQAYQTTYPPVKRFYRVEMLSLIEVAQIWLPAPLRSSVAAGIAHEKWTVEELLDELARVD